MMPTRRADLPFVAGELPAPSVELTLAAVILRTHLKTLKPKARQRYLRAISETLGEFETNANVVRIRGREHDAAVAQTRKEAAAWLRATLGAFFVADGERL